MHRNYVECIYMKTRRQAAILGFIGAEPVTSQRMLQRRLKADGFQVTQATISRDIKELGLVKQAADGAYRPAGQEAANLEAAHAALYRALADFVTRIDRVQQLIVLGTGTRPGSTGRPRHRPRQAAWGGGDHRGRRHRPDDREERSPSRDAGGPLRGVDAGVGGPPARGLSRRAESAGSPAAARTSCLFPKSSATIWRPTLFLHFPPEHVGGFHATASASPW